MKTSSVYLPSKNISAAFLDAVAADKAYLRPGQWVNFEGQRARYVTKDNKGTLFFSLSNGTDDLFEWNSRFVSSYNKLKPQPWFKRALNFFIGY